MSRVLSAALFVLLSGSALRAQEVFGVLRRADIDAPSQGTLVVAERVADGQVVA
jgi:hypothetical protein